MSRYLAAVARLFNRLQRLRRVGARLWLAKLIGKSTGYPNLAGVLVTRSRLWWNPVAHAKRRRWSRQFPDTSIPFLRLSPQDGYGMFASDRFSQIKKIVSVCNDILDAKGRRNLETWHAERSSSESKNFFFNVLEEEDILQNPELMEFALSDEVLSTIVPYYRMLPRLCSIGLFYSRVSSTSQRSQNFHIDGTDPHHVKCFVNISNVGPKDGPFTFIPAGRTEELRRRNGGMLRSAGLEDGELLLRYEKDYGLSLTGEPGSGAFVDTSRCLHYGSRCEESHRIVFMFHYAVFANYTELEKNPLRDIRMQHYPNIRERFGVDELRNNVLLID